MNLYRTSGFSMLPEVVKNLLIINVLAYLARMVFLVNFEIDLNDYFGLHYWEAEKFRPYQFVTYMFMHGSFSHLFFNMFAVWMFGNAIENAWGPKRFLIFYIFTGLGAAIIHYTLIHLEISGDISAIQSIVDNPSFEGISNFVANHQFAVSQYYPEIYPQYQEFKGAYSLLAANPNNYEALNISANFFSDYLEHYKNMPNVVGASGSLFGILLAFGMMFPNAQLFMLFIPFPIKAKYFVMGYGAIELFSGLQNNPGDNVAHFAHLGGMLFGFILIKFWRKKGIY